MDELTSDDEVKPSINNALFPLVPPDMTIREFDELACKVYGLVVDVREEWRRRRTESNG